MEFIHPHLLIGQDNRGWYCKECGESGFQSRDYAIFHIESEHVYYDQEQRKWLKKITLREHEEKIKQALFQEQLNELNTLGLNIDALQEGNGKIHTNDEIEYRPNLRKIRKTPHEPKKSISNRELKRDERAYAKGISILCDEIEKKAIESEIHDLKRIEKEDKRQIREFESKKKLILIERRKEIRHLERENQVIERILLKSTNETVNGLIKEEKTKEYTRKTSQVKKRKTYSREELISEYRRVKDVLNRTLLVKDFQGPESFSRISSAHYIKDFGSWRSLLEELGEELPKRSYHRTQKWSEDDLFEEYHKLEERLGRQPVYTDFRGPKRTSKIHASIYERTFGSWGKFLETVGGVKYKTQKGPGKQALIDNYFEVKRKIGRRPKIREFDQHARYGVGYYRSHFGGYKKFLVEIGECNGRPLNRKYTRQQLIDIYSKIKKEIGHPPSQTELRKHGISESTYITGWGNWKNFKDHIGDKINYHGKYTKKDVIDAYWKAKQEQGRIPHSREIAEHMKGSVEPIKRYFGGIRGLVESMGDRYMRHNKLPREKHVQRYLIARESLGRVPHLKEFKETTGYWPDSASKHFGGYTNYVQHCENLIQAIPELNFQA